MLHLCTWSQNWVGYRADRSAALRAWSVSLACPVGLAVVRGLDTNQGIISSFFIVHGARRSGIGRAAAKHVTGLQPGPWSVAFQDSNSAASKFWPTVAAEADDHWTLERREAPGYPALPADSWVRFGVR